MALNSTNRPKSLINHVICPIGLHELHLWEINLNSSSNEDAGLIELLSEEEHRRASAFKSTVARKEFLNRSNRALAVKTILADVRYE